MQNVNHYDSLEKLDEEIEGTYRVELPHPQTVENEDEFITNSARNTKVESCQDSLNESQTYQQQRLKYVQPDKRGEGMQFSMTESLQAQLHLSLDRLSQASFETREKTKLSDVYGKVLLSPTKTLSSAPPYSVQSLAQKFEQADQEQLGDLSDSVEVANAVVPGKFSSLKDSLSNMSMGAVVRKELKDSDDDDINIVAVDDSLNGDEGQVTLSEDLLSSERSMLDSKTKPGEIQPDRYADLRYNPGWREVSQNSEPSLQSPEINPEFVIDFRNAPRLPSTPPQHQIASHGQIKTALQPSVGGAITVHNTELSPTRPDSNEEKLNPPKEQEEFGYYIGRDSPVRLSADPNRLDSMNQLYEEEFARMLQLERQWTQENSMQNHAEENMFSNHNHQQLVQHELQTIKQNDEENVTDQESKPKYYSPRIREQNSQTTSINNDSSKSIRNKRSLHMVSHAPTPPRAPKSIKDKDYIEMNKIRLGRKSNSASYLEIYSKRNKQLQDEHNDQLRPKSDTNKLTQKSDNYIHDDRHRSPPSPKENQGIMGLEDVWKQQANRLKGIKDGRESSKLPQRKTLRELGNTREMNRPLLNPEELITKRYSPRKFPSPRNHPEFEDENDNFANHPAFSSFDHHRNTLHRRQQLLHDQYLKLSQQNESSIGVNSSYQESDESQCSDNHVGAYQTREEPQDDPRYYYAHGEAPQTENFVYQSPVRPSPLLQAYKQRYDNNTSMEQQSSHVDLPPKPDNPLSPRNISGDFFPVQIAAQNYPESQYYHPQTFQLKKRVNFDPAVQSPHSPASRIPIPVSSHAYKYQVPLPPTNGLSVKKEDAYFSSPRSSSLKHGQRNNRETTWTSNLQQLPNRKQTLPLLPPILGTSGKTEDKLELDTSLVSNDDGGGSYLEQYEKQKQKAKYKKYTLEDYKNLKRDLNLGGLGPDLITAREKMGKIDRARKYAEFIRQQHKNHQQLVQKNPTAPEDKSYDEDISRERDEGAQRFVVMADSEDKKKEQKEKRKRALEYARQVPRPKTIFQPNQENLPPSATQNPLENNGEPLDWDLLKSLQERHEREKALVAQLSTTKMT